LKGIASKLEFEESLVSEHQGVYFVSFAAECLKSKNIYVVKNSLEFIGQLISIGKKAE
jgi:hypothetical protein